jgi:short subunit dehydrogenase-like uncharacterized protein
VKPIYVVGATGYTGSLVVEALRRRDVPLVAVARDERKLADLEKRLGCKLEKRRADVTRPEDLVGLFEGAGAVINTVGPFARYGEAVVEAAIEAGAHYVDTTGEQSFQRRVYERFHRAAIGKRIAVVTGHAFEFAISAFGAALLHKRVGPVVGVSSYHRVRGFRPSRGTFASALDMLGRDFVVYRDGNLVEPEIRFTPKQIRLPGEAEELSAIEVAGGDVVMLALDIQPLRMASCHVVFDGTAARFTALLSGLRGKTGPAPFSVLARYANTLRNGVREPTPSERQRVEWTVWVDALSESGAHVFRAQGRDVYGISAELVTLAAIWLAEGRGLDIGVLSSGRALDPVASLDALAEAGVSWDLR